jgi:hypothetical protein
LCARFITHLFACPEYTPSSTNSPLHCLRPPSHEATFLHHHPRPISICNTTARAFSAIASTLSIPSLLPFLKAVCRSKKSWQARHGTGIRVVQQIAIMMGCTVLPHLRNFVAYIAHDLQDDQQKMRTMTALGLAALAEAAVPYGKSLLSSFVNFKPLTKR